MLVAVGIFLRVSQLCFGQWTVLLWCIGSWVALVGIRNVLFRLSRAFVDRRMSTCVVYSGLSGVFDWGVDLCDVCIIVGCLVSLFFVYLFCVLL